MSSATSYSYAWATQAVGNDLISPTILPWERKEST